MPVAREDIRYRYGTIGGQPVRSYCFVLWPTCGTARESRWVLDAMCYVVQCPQVREFREALLERGVERET